MSTGPAAVVALLLCPIEGAIFAQLTYSLYGGLRPAKLIAACPVMPDVLALTPLPTLVTAQRLWNELCAGLEPYRTTGQGAWFRFTEQDRTAFNRTCLQAFGPFQSSYSSSLWSIKFGPQQLSAMTQA